MAAAPRLRSGVDPLFTVVFCAAAILNMTTALVPEPTAARDADRRWTARAFLARVARARRVASTQGARELRAFRTPARPRRPARRTASTPRAEAPQARGHRESQNLEVSIAVAIDLSVQLIEDDQSGAFCRHGDTGVRAPRRHAAIDRAYFRVNRSTPDRTPTTPEGIVRGTLFAHSSQQE
jgi:hypothetical protein